MTSGILGKGIKSTLVRELRIHQPDGGTKIIRLEGDRISIGRSSDNDLGYPEDSRLSRHHLCWEREGTGWVVRDLGSKNGTLVNGLRITGKTTLHTGDRVQAGQLVLVYGDSAAESTEKVVFVDPKEPDTGTRTIVSSLQGMLSERTGEEVPGRAVLEGAARVNALIRAGRELASHRPLEDLFRVILALAIEAVDAQRGVLMTLEKDQLVARAVRGSGFRISSTVRDQVLMGKSSLLVRNVLQDDTLKSRKSIIEQNVSSLMAIPLQTNDRVIGLIYVDLPGQSREFTHGDLNLLTVMANVAAIRIEQQRLSEVEQEERRLAQELEQAALIQHQALPAGPPLIPGIELAGYNAACRTVGGDYYDFLSLPDGRVVLVVGDVSGKGMPAALLMMSLQARVQVLVSNSNSLCELAAQLNKMMLSSGLFERFVTFFVCALNPVNGEITYCNAGHNPPILVRTHGEIETLEEGGPVLGILPGIIYQEGHCHLDVGDVLALYSDGVIDAANSLGEQFELERLLTTLAKQRTEPAAAILDSVCRVLADWAEGTPAPDDITLVVARRTG